MKRTVAVFILLFFLLLPAAAFADNRDTIVHRTATGAKYHNASCQYLRQSDIEITLEEAVRRGLTACSKCHPPIPDFDLTVTPHAASTPKPATTPKPTAAKSGESKAGMYAAGAALFGGGYALASSRKRR